MKNFVTSLGAIIALALLISASTCPSPARASSPIQTDQYIVRANLFSESLTEADKRALNPDRGSILDGGDVATARFQLELGNLQSSGKILMAHVSQTTLGAGESKGMSLGSGESDSEEFVEDVSPQDLIVSLEESGDAHEAATLALDLHLVGAYAFTNLKTSLTLGVGRTYIFSLGTTPDNKRNLYLTVSLDLSK